MRNKSFLINEVFLSVQGEGPRVGRIAVFVRFSGCNLNCSFCDTNHEQYIEYDVASLVAKAKEVSLGLKGIDCILTGGEPLLQANGELCYELGNAGFNVTLETNASKVLTETNLALYHVNSVIYYCDYVVSSPKDINYSKWILRNSNCLKLAFPLKFYDDENVLLDMVDSVGVDSGAPKDLVVQPITIRDNNRSIPTHDFQSICALAYNFAAKRNLKFRENWRVIPQTHVFMGLK